MRYSGGKEGIAAKIAAVLQPYVDRAGGYCEPFLGGASVFARVRAPVKYGSDANPWLMCMWQAAATGWVPPTEVDEATYADLKVRKPMEPITAFVGFGCSFGGKWFGGPARDSTGRSYAAVAQRSVARKIAGFGSCVLTCASYDECPVPPGAVIYCDPPYADTTNGYSTGSFDHSRFWEGVRAAERVGHAVFVSEYTAPPDFDVVATFAKKVTMDKRNGYADKGEKLFRWSGAHA